MKSYYATNIGYLIIICLGTFGNILAQNCNTVPLSLSNLQFCEDDKCYFSQQITLSIPSADNSKSCIEFIPPGPDATSTVVNITTHVSKFHWAIDYCYYTDSPFVDGQGWCGCPNGNPGNCNNCPDSNPHGDIVLCNSGVHNDDYCILTWVGKSGTWCFRAGLSASKRYKVCKVQPLWRYLSYVSIQTENEFWGGDFDGTQVSYDHPVNYLNMTLVTTTAKPHISANYIVFDKHAPGDFYLLDSDDVNPLNGNDPNKIGWLKVGSTVTAHPSIGSLISVKLQDCEDNKFSVTYPWSSIETLLTSRRNRLSHIYAPGSYITDPEFLADDSNLQIPNHHINPYHYVKTGFIMYSSDIGVQFIGLDFNNKVIGSHTDWTFTGTTVANYWSHNGVSGSSTTFLCAGGPYLDLVLNSVQRVGVCWLSAWSVSNVLSDFFFCRYDVGAAGAEHLKYSCVNATFHYHSWPSFKTATTVYRQGHLTTTLSGTDHLMEELTVPAIEGSTTLLLQFRNMSVKFITSNVKPSIKSATIDQSGIVSTTAKSITVSGECYYGVDPPVLAAPLSIGLTTQFEVFNITLLHTNFTGGVLVYISCHKYTANTTIYYNSTFFTPGSFNEEEVSNPFHEQVSDFLPDLFGVGDGFWNTILQVLSWVLLIGAIVIISPIVLFITTKIITYSWSLYRSTLPSMPKLRGKFIRTPEVKYKYM